MGGCSEPTDKYYHQCNTNTNFPDSFKALSACIETGKEAGMELKHTTFEIEKDGSVSTFYTMATKIKPKDWDKT